MDVIFHQSLRPSGTVQESEYYFSGKHDLYGYKTDVSVLPTGYAIGFSNTYGGSVADIIIYSSNIEWHKSAFSKSVDREHSINDDEEMIDKFPEN